MPTGSPPSTSPPARTRPASRNRRSASPGWSGADEDLFVSVTLPNILVGSVGGGTGLPSQAAALDLLGLKGAGKGAALAEVVAALCLCGEISIMGAIAAGHFACAHDKLARRR